MVFDFSQHSLQFISHTLSYLSPLSEVPTSLQQLTFTSFPTHILNFFIKYLSPLSEVPTALQQLTFTRLPTHILNFFIKSYLSPLSEVPTSLQQLTFTSFPTHILNFFIISYLSPLSEVPTSLQQLTFTSFPTHILNFLHHILPLFRSFIPYSSFLSRLFSLYLSPLVPSFITYSSSFNSRLFLSKRKLSVERNLYRRATASYHRSNFLAIDICLFQKQDTSDVAPHLKINSGD